MKIKTKLTLGVGLLFLLIIVLSLVAVRYVNALKNDTENILAANYNTVEYSRNMILALDSSNQHTAVDFKRFEHNLREQQKNITETGEKETTALIAQHFAALKSAPGNMTLPSLIRRDISELMRLNMEAIQRKSNIAKETAQTATIWIMATGTLCFLIAFTLLINLPEHISSPIKELTKSIKEIAAENYAQRVHFDDHNEFGELALSFNTMASKLEEFHTSNLYNLLFEKKRIDTLINNMHDPVIGLDEHQQVLFANNEALKIAGLKKEETIGKSAVELALHNDLIRYLMQEIRATDKHKNALSERPQPIKIFADNKESYFEKEVLDIAITPTGEKTKKHIGNVILLKNITPFKELDFAKTNFIATVSHELKTPISSIKMSLTLLEQQRTGNTNEEQKQLISSIREDSNRLLKITGELLNLSQIETGNIQLNMQQSSPYTILDYALDSVKTTAEQKNISLSVQAADNLPEIKADADKTAWVLINLLTNAIRYSPEQSMVTIYLKQETGGVVFSVKDQGKGIDDKYQEKIFDRYFQIPGSPKTGTGLGLTISKDFIEAQGGAIGVISTAGSGSEFYFRLHEA